MKHLLKNNNCTISDILHKIVWTKYGLNALNDSKLHKSDLRDKIQLYPTHITPYFDLSGSAEITTDDLHFLISFKYVQFKRLSGNQFTHSKICILIIITIDYWHNNQCILIIMNYYHSSNITIIRWLFEEYSADPSSRKRMRIEWLTNDQKKAF